MKIVITRHTEKELKKGMTMRYLELNNKIKDLKKKLDHSEKVRGELLEALKHAQNYLDPAFADIEYMDKVIKLAEEGSEV